MQRSELMQLRRFIIELGTSLHAYGAPSHRLENLLQETTDVLGVEGTFLVTPTTMHFLFRDKASDEEYSHIERVQPNALDLNRLAYTHDLVDQVLAGQVSLEQGLDSLEQIRLRPEPYPRWLMFLAWGVLSASFAAVCGAGLHEVFAACAAGWLAYGLVVLAEHSKRLEEMLEPLAALLIALVSSGVAALGGQFNLPIVILSGIIAFIPGLVLTIGLRELAARHLLSGTTRIMDAGMMMFKLYFGAVFGLALGALWWTAPLIPIQASTVSWASYLAVLGLSVSLLIIFKISWRDAPWGLVSGTIAYLSASFGTELFGASLGGLVGAFVVGLYANAYSLIKNRPTATVLLPGIVLLVPGSKIYIGLNNLVTGEAIIANTVNGAQVFLAFMAIVAGLMFANMVLPPKRRH
ncbi:MAG TPA: threonine/serine exporter family protein [Thiolinea sp.]|nr:threonine/serine exporter family protein [Thiolinea sp.]